MHTALEQAFQGALLDRARAFRDLSALQAKEVPAAAAAALDSLAAAGPEKAEMWGTFTPLMLDGLANLTPAQLGAFRALTPEGLTALEMSLARDVKRRADGLAWLALLEVLVFFGVLLVGFAYLWRRGDLAWVRSTAAEDREEGGRMKDEVRVAV
ncbi:MAG: NADH-quinone oxidoreductase subunit A [Gemmataceae bacterium]